MNFLFHLYLSGADEELLVGNFMGDFVKGPLDNSYPPRIRQGLLLHRKIDAFAQRDATFQTSRLRLPAEYGLYRGVLIDLFYDHFLAKEWDSHSAIPFAAYLASTRKIIDQHLAIMPPHLQGIVPLIFSDFLPSYHSIPGIERALRRMSRRVKRENPLAAGGAELSRYYGELLRDFNVFTPNVQRFVADFLVSSLPAD